MNEQPFFVKDCAIAAIATGIKAQTLSEFRDRLATIALGSLYFHFWQGRVHSAFEYWDYYNDFSRWAHDCLHDDTLAERLELINPTEYSDLENLREEVLEIVENRLDELEIAPWSKREDSFHFIRSKIIVFRTQNKINQPKELVNIIPLMSRSSVFYHFIDARRRTENAKDDLTIWLNGFHGEYEGLVDSLQKIDPYFIALGDLQQKLIMVTTDYFLEKEHLK